MEISIMHWDLETSLEGDEMLEFIEDKFDVKFVGRFGIDWDNMYEVPFLWAASGELADIISGVDLASWNGQVDWINDGLLRPLPDDLSAYPNVARLVSAGDVQIFAVDGKNYLLPRASYGDPDWWCMDRGILNRKDFREALGFDVPVTEQDFFDLCVAYSKADLVGQGAGYTKGMYFGDKNMPYSQTLASYGYTDSYWVMNDEGEVVMPAVEKTSLPLMDFLRRLNKAGGLDVDYVTDDRDDSTRQKFSSGKVGMILQQVTPKHVNLVFEEWSKQFPNENAQVFFDSIEILDPPVRDGKPVGFCEKTFWSETYIGADVDDEKMDRILQIFDYLISEEGNNLVTFGFEGKDWEYDADGNIVILTETNPDTGQPKTVVDLYPFCYSMNYLATWNDGASQYVNPNIAQPIRDMCQVELDKRLATWNNGFVDWKIAALDVEERNEFTPETIKEEWAKIILDTSNASTEDIFDKLYTSWEANGYKAAKNAMTAAAK